MSLSVSEPDKLEMLPATKVQIRITKNYSKLCLKQTRLKQIHGYKEPIFMSRNFFFANIVYLYHELQL